MKRLNVALNLFLFVALLLTSGTALLLCWRLPHGRFAEPMCFLGWNRHVWLAVHQYLGLAMVAGVIAHLGLHWRWIWRVAAGQRRVTLFATLGVSAAVLAFFLWMPVEPAQDGYGRGRQVRWFGPPALDLAHPGEQEPVVSQGRNPAPASAREHSLGE